VTEAETMGRRVIDLFAGIGGGDVAARTLNMDPLGIELDDAACETRNVAGLRTLQADVAALHPVDFAPCHGLIGSPPCQAFSMAGKGAGRVAIPHYWRAIERMVRREPVDLEELDRRCADPRAHLVLEPLRWVLALEPRWVALEQVEPVLPLWEGMAMWLQRLGYYAWTGILSAERYGVPQTRRRAILIASLDRPVGPPPATHQRYVAPRRRGAQDDALFAVDEPARIVPPEDRGLLPWVNMAEALGHGMTHRPTHTVTAGGTGAGGGVETFASGDVRAIMLREASEGRWVMLSNARSRASVRDIDEPAPTIMGGGHSHWVTKRPATSVTGDPRSSEPGHHASDVSGSQQASAVRVSVEEALVLQSFPPNYPVRGTKTQRFTQVGNAIPPSLALAVLREALGIEARLAA
jgi:DNA (cytosine-5)-methyltransferase 1